MVTTSKSTIHLTFLTLEEVSSLYLYIYRYLIDLTGPWDIHYFFINPSKTSMVIPITETFPEQYQVFGLGCQDLYPHGRSQELEMGGGKLLGEGSGGLKRPPVGPGHTR